MATSIRRPSTRARFLSVVAMVAILAAAAVLALARVAPVSATVAPVSATIAACTGSGTFSGEGGSATLTINDLAGSTEGKAVGTVARLVGTEPPVLAASTNNAVVAPTVDFTINWGDGSGVTTVTVTGTVSSSASGTTTTFDVPGGHAYAEEGSYTISVGVPNHITAALSVGIADLISACKTVSIGDAPISLTAGTSFSVKETRTTGNRQLATIQDTNPSPDAADFPEATAATVDWGDGASGPGSVVDGAVSGAHVYGKPGSYPVKVSVVDSGGSTATTTLTATVTATLVGTGKTLTATEGIPMPPPHAEMTGPVIASFTDLLLGSTSAGNFQASINWGDGTAATAGTVVSTGRDNEENPTFDVQGAHQYAEEGTYTAVVTLRDELGRTGTASTTVTVSDAALTAAAGSAISGIKANPTGTLVLATFSDANLAAGLSDFTASINWGDGTTASAGTVGAGTTAAHFTVSGSHTYAAAGTFTVKVTITDHANQATVSVTATVTAPAVLAATGQRWPIDPEFSWNLGIALLLLGLAVLAWGRFVRGRYVWRSRP